MNSKILFGIPVVGMVAVSLVLMWWNFSLVDELKSTFTDFMLVYASTNNYETYTNEDYGFTIDYLSDWEEQESDLAERQVVKFLATKNIPAVMSIYIGKINPNISLYEAVNVTDSVDIRPISMTNTTVAGMSAVEETYYQYEFGSTAKIKKVTMLNDKNLDLIVIRYTVEPENFEEYLPAFDHMVQSFKVTEIP